jgi:hypothetical protein
MVAILLNSDMSMGNNQIATWRPVVTDRLIKMDTQTLERELGKQFSGSQLAEAQASANAEIAGQAESIINLKKAINAATSEGAKTNLRYRELNERGSLVLMLGNRTSLRRQKAEAELVFYEQLLSRIDNKDKNLSDQEKRLIEAERHVINRINNAESVMSFVVNDSRHGSSGYGSEYTIIQNDLQRLYSAIEDHVANSTKGDASIPLTKSEYILQKIVQAQGEYALAVDENKMTGLMAKLLALDATALEMDMDPVVTTSTTHELPTSHANNVVELFLN